ncbi:MAG: DinB family protein [Vicinamibacterales bacterium]
MPEQQLVVATLDFARLLAAIDDHSIGTEWPDPPAEGTRWSGGYDDTIRETVFRAYQQLCGLAAMIASSRTPPTEAQLILAQHHRAYRDLTGALAVVGDDVFDLEPAEGEWPLRIVVYHIALAERGFHALIHWAVRRQRTGNTLPIEMPDAFRDEVSEPIREAGAIADVLVDYDRLHRRVMDEFVDLTEIDLAAPNVWWEGWEVPARFRLHRFDSHLREHTIQVDKTLAGIGRSPTEPERLARLLHRALGEVEVALLGAAGMCADQRRAVADDIDDLIARLPD